jgi:S1-C subfamily serine protease
MQAPGAIEVSQGRDPPEPKKVSLGIFVEPSPQGLVVTGLRREGWCTAVGMEPGDVIQQINQYPATSSEDLRIALQDQIGAGRIQLSVVSADGSPSNFLIPLPLAEIEPHILGSVPQYPGCEPWRWLTRSL